MEKNQAYKAMQRPKHGSSAGPEDMEDAMVMQRSKVKSWDCSSSSSSSSDSDSSSSSESSSSDDEEKGSRILKSKSRRKKKKKSKSTKIRAQQADEVLSEDLMVCMYVCMYVY
ncbi:hypothetical protein E1A91_A02G010400v1 [Gossypium mustelinum]|uniref:Uncharacterized protein n=1 Tax=Gossypium mustelinum TaxID=34275 RepID=A0A5D3A074_GOSMU|nr:hypothetical protein E1A91_A02G010400v1 [Gossypium mustelinum]